MSLAANAGPRPQPFTAESSPSRPAAKKRGPSGEVASSRGPSGSVSRSLMPQPVSERGQRIWRWVKVKPVPGDRGPQVLVHVSTD